MLFGRKSSLFIYSFPEYIIYTRLPQYWTIRPCLVIISVADPFHFDTDPYPAPTNKKCQLYSDFLPSKMYFSKI